jgi:hypothetical protein
MAISKNIKPSLVVIILISAGIIFLTRCIGDSDKSANKETDEFKKYAGSKTCMGCHNDIYNTHIYTEHYLTLSLPTEINILGSFEEGKNTFAFSNVSSVKMEKRDSGFFQVEYNNGNEIRKGRFDIVVGSGRKGQSYLSWIKNRLVQMPITFFTPENQWSNSPGYPPYKIVFNRLITSRCLECHST